MNGQGCHCLCIVNHKTVVGCCEGQATTTVLFNAVREPREIPMCRACAVATEAARATRAARAT